MWVAAPSAAALLADWGADVIKVEAPTGDPMRNVFGSLGIDDDMPNPAFALDNRGKRSVVLDLRDADGPRPLRGPAGRRPTCSSATSGPTPSTSSTSSRTPPSPATRASCTAASAATASQGEERNRPTYDIGAFWARSGLSRQMADGEGNPLNARGGIGDHITGLASLAGILAAVIEQRADRARAGSSRSSLLRTGTYVLGWDLGLQMTLGKVAGAEPRHRNQAPLMNPYRTKDDRWFFFTGLEAARHLPAGAPRPRPARPARRRALRQRRRRSAGTAPRSSPCSTRSSPTRTLDEWAEAFEREGVWWAPAQTPAEVVDDPQLIANDGFVELDGGGPGAPCAR